jgi:hypothetical protein
MSVPIPLQSLVGHVMTEKSVAAIEKTAKASGLTRVRVFTPNTMGDMEYDEQRLNVHVNGAGSIERLDLG